MDKSCACSDCLPQPVQTTQGEIVKIYTIIFVDFLLLVFDCYALRLRPLICGFFYRKVACVIIYTTMQCYDRQTPQAISQSELIHIVPFLSQFEFSAKFVQSSYSINSDRTIQFIFIS